MSDLNGFCVEIGGPRPRFRAVADHLWGPGVDIDSDGDSATPEDPNWTELTVIKRPDYEERVDVDRVSSTPLILNVRSTSLELARRAAVFLANSTNGKIVECPPPTADRW